MSIFHDNALIGAAGQAAGGGYQVSRSLRFSSGDSSYLSRTPASAGNRKTWTWSGWVKRSGTNRACLFSGGTTQSDTGFTSIEFESDFTLRVTGWNTLWAKSNALYRDFSAWYHIVVSFDSTQASAANQIKIYVNGSQITKATENALTQNTDYGVNQAVRHTIGAISEDANASFNNFYLADIWFLDGIATDASSFGETDATTGQWIPKTYSGSKGSNGFHLEFADNSNNTATTLGKDTSGNGLNWTPNNFSVTAGAGNDSLVDTPTSYGTDTGAGGEVRGNYCTWNPLPTTTAKTFSDGNLQVVGSGTDGYSRLYGTFGMSSGKWYFEVVPTAIIGYVFIGISASEGNAYSSNAYYYASNTGYKSNRGAGNNNVAYGSTFTANDVIGVAVDMDTGKIWFAKNGTWQASGNPTAGTNAAYADVLTYLKGAYVPYVTTDEFNSYTVVLNAGQRAFAYTAPSGFKALCDTNLPAPVVAKPNTVMDIALYTGNGASRSITGFNFGPDLVWIKRRNDANAPRFFDIVRGAGAHLTPAGTDAEYTTLLSLSSFNSDGFGLGNNTDGQTNVNINTGTYVAWCWDAGSSAASINNSGSIQSTVKVNATSGCAVVTYSGSSSNSTIGHGLGAPVDFAIFKNRTNGGVNWKVYHKSLGNTKALTLNTTAAEETYNYWQNTTPTSTLFYLSGGVSNTCSSGDNFVAYMFSQVAGYSSMGSYVASSGLPFVYLGFRPRFLLIKNITTASTNWRIIDSARDTYNDGSGAYWLKANTSDAEVDERPVDFLSNGFKLRMTDAGDLNYSSDTYIYFAVAENPFAYARAR